MNQQEQMLYAIIDGILNDTPEILQQLSQLNETQQQEIFKLIAYKAEQGDQKAAAAIQKLKNPKVAKLGSKLNYIKMLKGCCPEGSEIAYAKNGKKFCKPCQKMACGKKMKKKK